MNRQRLLLAVVGAALLLLSAATGQNTFWVDAGSGNDSNPGSHTKPFKSITKGVSILSQGDTLYVQPGTYSTSKTGESFPITVGNGPVNQNKVRIIGIGGAENTILDGGGAAIAYMMRFYPGSTGAKLYGIHFTNTQSTSSRWWDMGVRLGSYSGGNFAAKNIEVSGCIFSRMNRGIVIWQIGGGGHRVHHNLFYNNGNDNIDIYGNHVNAGADPRTHVFNNVSVGSSTLAYLLAGTAVNITFANNIANKNSGKGFVCDYTSKKVVFENNCAYGNTGTNYQCKVTPSKSNWTIDPLFVNPAKNDYHLQPTSKMIEMGYPGLTALYTTPDLYGHASLFDRDGDGNVLPDIGCHESADATIALKGTWTRGGNVTIAHQGPKGYLAVLFMSLDVPGVGLPQIGSFLLDPVRLLPINLATSSTGTIPLVLPNDPWFSGGITVYLQSIFFSPKMMVKPSNLELGVF